MTILNYDDARAKKTSLEAQLKDVELQRELGILVLAADVSKAWENVLGAMKAKLMALPTKAAPIVASESEAAVCQHLLEALVNESLEELANYEPQLPDIVESEEDTSPVSPVRNASPEAATETKRKRVGRPRKAVGRSK